MIDELNDAELGLVSGGLQVTLATVRDTHIERQPDKTKQHRCAKRRKDESLTFFFFLV